MVSLETVKRGQSSEKILKPKKANRLELDKETSIILKGIAIFLIILTHYPKNAIIGTMFNGLGGWGVSIFLFLSGYGLFVSYSKNGLKRYWIKKLKKVYIPFIIAMLVQVIVRIIVLKTNFNRIDLIASLLGINPSNVIDSSMWYISYLMIWYILFFVIFIIKISEKFKLILLFCSTILVYQISSSSPFYSCGAILYTLLFPLGVLYGYIKNFKYKINNFLVVILFMSFLLIWAFIKNNMNWWWVFFIFIPIVVIFLVKSFSFKKLKIFNLLGKYSYYIYLFEYLAFSIIKELPNVAIPILSDIITIIYFSVLLCGFVILINIIAKTIIEKYIS